MNRKDEQSQKEHERAFKESVIRFADAFVALTEEEQNDLISYTEGRCKDAEENYNKLKKKK